MIIVIMTIGYMQLPGTPAITNLPKEKPDVLSFVTPTNNEAWNSLLQRWMLFVILSQYHIDN